jgi:hypothetical protein
VNQTGDGSVTVFFWPDSAREIQFYTSNPSAASVWIPRTCDQAPPITPTPTTPTPTPVPPSPLIDLTGPSLSGSTCKLGVWLYSYPGSTSVQVNYEIELATTLAHTTQSAFVNTDFDGNGHIELTLTNVRRVRVFTISPAFSTEWVWNTCNAQQTAGIAVGAPEPTRDGLDNCESLVFLLDFPANTDVDIYFGLRQAGSGAHVYEGYWGTMRTDASGRRTFYLPFTPEPGLEFRVFTIAPVVSSQWFPFWCQLPPRIDLEVSPSGTGGCNLTAVLTRMHPYTVYEVFLLANNEVMSITDIMTDGAGNGGGTVAVVPPSATTYQFTTHHDNYPYLSTVKTCT